MPTFDNGEGGLSVRTKINNAITKVDGMEEGATADQTGAEIKALYEAEPDTNAFTDADHSKLDGIESGATADQSEAEIKTAYENNANTNAFTDSEQTKLAGIEASADVTDTANVTAAGAVMDSELTNEAAVKAIDQGLATTSNVDFGDVTLAGVLKTGKGADVASAAALTLGTDGNSFDVTGTTTITSIATWHVGGIAILQFDGALTLTHHATDLILPGAANITTAAGDIAVMYEYASGDWRCVSYQRAANAPGGGISNVVEDATPQLGGDLDAQSNNITGVGDFGDGTTSVGAEYLVHGSAKAWMNFNGTGTIAARDSFNVSSLTDNGTGDYSINFTNNMSSGDYTLSGQASGATTGMLYCRNTVGDKTGSSITFNTLYASNTSGAGQVVDLNTVDGVIHGDLA